MLPEVASESTLLFRLRSLIPHVYLIVEFFSECMIDTKKPFYL